MKFLQSIAEWICPVFSIINLVANKVVRNFVLVCGTLHFCLSESSSVYEATGALIWCFYGRIIWKKKQKNWYVDRKLLNIFSIYDQNHRSHKQIVSWSPYSSTYKNPLFEYWNLWMKNLYGVLNSIIHSNKRLPLSLKPLHYLVKLHTKNKQKLIHL